MIERKVKRIKLVVQYDGTDFCGWAEQSQVRTVQGTLKESIRRAIGEEVELRGASRTDSGVHATGQVCDFATHVPIPSEKWPRILNRLLPMDMRVYRASFVPLRFHSRFFARSRVYEYRMVEDEHPNPMISRYVFNAGYSLDVEAMNSCAQLLLGTHDFSGFAIGVQEIENPVRTMLVANVNRVRDEVRIRLEATAFLRGMVRKIAGALWEIGRGKRSVEEFEALLQKEVWMKSKPPRVLPPKGLTLVKVKYGRRLRDIREEYGTMDEDE
ncbi:MAG TPA: tRNA pseudouridine(38-40) synthase TruA [Fimbriimonadales bacterium]|nr:tRNA pseudouridine(38-40) synthase TruA [Fimbriimonadales bacterium]